MKAYELIEKPENWTQMACARDAINKIVNPESKSAVKFCIVGALIRACGTLDYSKSNEKLEKALGVSNAASVGEWNDSHTHQECYELLKKLDI